MEVDNFTLIVIFAFVQIIPTLAITILLTQMKNYTILEAFCIYYKQWLIFYKLCASLNNRVMDNLILELREYGGMAKSVAI